MGDDEVGAVVSRLNDLISRWSDPASPRKVRPKDVIPDSTNREGTLVSIEHAHGIAWSIVKEGFSEAHEVPVVVRGDAGATLRGDAYKRWRRFVRDNAAVMPPLRSKRSWARSGVAYTTLGSSHLNLALRLVETDTPSVFGQEIHYADALARSEKLRDAVERGLRAVVLRDDTPFAARKEISLALNKASLLGFRLGEDGVARLEARETGVTTTTATNGVERELSVYEALSRTLDSEELSSLARIRHGIDWDRAKAGYEDGARKKRAGGGSRRFQRARL
mmetsp:Transcript_5069/g.20833  ORF Transcript_5069/g.20833 Transcript_5069/m.20833 type:complete len:278 (-) Transcript_5069:1659-2492(-)